MLSMKSRTSCPLQDLGFLELEVEVVALAGPLADPAEHRLAAMALGDVVDQLLNHDRLAHPGAAEQTDLAALHERGDQVDDLDAGLEDLGLGLQVGELRRLPVNGPALDVLGQRRPAVHRLAQHVEDPAQRRAADRCGDRVAGIGDLHAAAHAVRAAHRHGAHLVLPDVLLDLGGETHRKAAAAVLELQRVVDLGQMLRLELNVEHRADDLDDAADVPRGGAGGVLLLGCD
jgi:peptide chain release factor 1